MNQIAHNIDNNDRTADVHIIENVDFTAMLLSDVVLQGLLANGFKKPSPIQLKAVPMGRCGYDLIIQAKSGTGKTAVFGIIALEMVDVTKSCIQVIILAPTREIAVQIKDVLQSIGMNLKGLAVQYFIGGTPIKDDLQKLKNCHIAVGAPGRVKHLIKDGHMKVDAVRLFVLDEADKLLAKEQQKDINFIYNKLNPSKQMIASSATYPGVLKDFLFKYMQTPTVIDPHQDVPVLLGIRQFVTIVKSHSNAFQQMSLKTNELIRILKNVSFTQCIVFCNYQTRAETLTNNLSHQGWPSTYISAAQDQKSRLDAVKALKEFKCRILTTTDLTARGIDAANVDLVINYEVPIDYETYLHRMGRAGRYGSSGICISITSTGVELEKLQHLLSKITSKLPVMKFPNENVPEDIWTCNVDQFEKLCQTVAIKNDSDQICNTLKELCVTQDSSDEKSGNKEHIIESIIEHVENECKEKSKDNVELLLQSLKKEDKQSKESCRNKLNNIDPATLLQMISKDLKIAKDKNSPKKINSPEKINPPEKINSPKKIKVHEKVQDENLENTEEHIDVQKMLSDLKQQEETSKNKIKLKFNMGPSSILNLIAQNNDSQNTIEPVREVDENIKKSKNKKIKRNNIENKDESSSSTVDDDIETNEQFENEAKLFQENSTIHKNIALYNLTKVVVKEELTEENVTSTKNLLKIMEQEDNLEIAEQKKKLEFIDLLSHLGIKSEEKPSNSNKWITISDNSIDNDTQSKTEPTSLNNWEEVDTHTQELEEQSSFNKWVVVSEKFIGDNTQAENNGSGLFNWAKGDNNSQKIKTNIAVKCACSENLLCDGFNFAISKSDNWRKGLCKLHNNIKIEETKDVKHEIEEHEVGEHMDDNVYEDIEEQYNESYEENEETIDIEVQMDEDIFVKAFDYALNREAQTYEEIKENNPEKDACGYAASHKYDHLVTKRKRRRHRKSKKSQVPLVLNGECSYESYYDQCDSMLKENGPYFADQSEFEKWFKKWQEQVSRVRNYVQDDMFAKELRKNNKN